MLSENSVDLDAFGPGNRMYMSPAWAESRNGVTISLHGYTGYVVRFNKDMKPVWINARKSIHISLIQGPIIECTMSPAVADEGL
ncbi:hypothetical protein AVEN_169553-1 [Araneus ventricosus]|uniref:Uncharacterized protein n=1 Tax=Araneus ventricosus TaxID=182803 RepID=A0A4Y2TVB3_ARAVE|nr:hypothetical protein AVEN_169553-1 [Araneus ventricosus]